MGVQDMQTDHVFGQINVTSGNRYPPSQPGGRKAANPQRLGRRGNINDQQPGAINGEIDVTLGHAVMPKTGRGVG